MTESNLTKSFAIPPTQDDLWEKKLSLIETTSDNNWRHGTYETNIFFREEDKTYWEVIYLLSTDGETNGLRDNDYSIYEVAPYVTTTTKYKRI